MLVGWAWKLFFSVFFFPLPNWNMYVMAEAAGTILHWGLGDKHRLLKMVEQKDTERLHSKWPWSPITSPGFLSLWGIFHVWEKYVSIYLSHYYLGMTLHAASSISCGTDININTHTHIYICIYVVSYGELKNSTKVFKK